MSVIGCLACFVLLGPGLLEPALADGVVKSEFAFQMDNSIFVAPEFNFADKLQGEEKFQLPDTDVEDLAPVRIRGIEANVKYKMRSGSKQIFLGAEHTIVSEELEASIAIREISVDSVIDRVVNGVRARVRVQGSCSNIELKLPKGAARVAGTLRTGLDAAGLPDVDVPWFDVGWTEGSWQVGEFNCTGVDGFKERVSEGLRKYLRDPSPFIAEMKKAVSEKVNAYEADVRSWFLEPRPVSVDLSGVRVTMYPKTIRNAATGRFLVRGVLEFVFASSTVNRTIEVRASVEPSEVASFSLFLPQGLPQALNDLAWETGFFTYREKGSNLAAFKKIREELINEVVVWPELQIYPKSAEFLFDFTSPQMAQLSPLAAEADGTPVGNVAGDIQVQSWAPSLTGGSNYYKFVRFDVPFNGRYRLKIVSGELRAVFTDLTMDLAHTWDAEYKKRVQFDKVNTDPMKDEIQKTLKGDGYGIALGKIPLTSLMNLSPVSVRLESGWLRIECK